MRPVGNIGDRGFFLGITGEGWWLLGLDVTNGRRLFGPMRLGSAGDATGFNCYVNGPPMVICVRQGPDLEVPSTAWVVDTSSGKLTFDGPTRLRVAGAQKQPRLEQIGDYAVAGAEGKGIYGVGPRGELTWFVPGNGMLPTQFTRPGRDTPPSTLAVQGSGGLTDVVFSVVDGTVVKPSVPQAVQLGQAIVYPGGFGYEYTHRRRVHDRVLFFDDTGNKLSEPEPGGHARDPLRRPATRGFEGERSDLHPGGPQASVELPPSGPAPDARLIGSRFFVATDADRRKWQQFDLRTGEPGKTCEGDSLGPYYIGSDGEVAVALGRENGPARGVDLATCETLWSIPAPAPSEAKEVWKVHGTLIQRTDDRLFSLVAPS